MSKDAFTVDINLDKILSKETILKFLYRVEGFMYAIQALPIYFLFQKNIYPKINAVIICVFNIYILILYLIIKKIEKIKK